MLGPVEANLYVAVTMLVGLVIQVSSNFTEENLAVYVLILILTFNGMFWFHARQDGFRRRWCNASQTGSFRYWKAGISLLARIRCK